MNSQTIKWVTGILGVLFIFLWITVFIERSKPQQDVDNEQVIATTTPSDEVSDTVLYEDDTEGFSVKYPKEYRISTSSDNQLFANGVSFLVPPSYAQGTNLSEDSRIYIEATSTCEVMSGEVGVVTAGNNIYQAISYADAGAGNLYETKVYVYEKVGGCYEISQFVHSTNIANYPLGEVAEFSREVFDADMQTVLKTFMVK